MSLGIWKLVDTVFMYFYNSIYLWKKKAFNRAEINDL